LLTNFVDYEIGYAAKIEENLKVSYGHWSTFPLISPYLSRVPAKHDQVAP